MKDSINLLKVGAYIYLVGFFIAILAYLSYIIQDMINFYIGTLVCIVYDLVLYICYIVINHTFILNFIPLKIILIAELLLIPVAIAMVLRLM